MVRGVRESLPAVCYKMRAILGRVYNLRVFGASNAEVNGVAGVPPWLPNVLVISIQMRPQMKHVKRSRLKGGSHVVHYNYSRGATIRRHCHESQGSCKQHLSISYDDLYQIISY